MGIYLKGANLLHYDFPPSTLGRSANKPGHEEEGRGFPGFPGLLLTVFGLLQNLYWIVN